MDLLTEKQMRALEKAAMDAGEVTGAALMERAGAAVVAAALHAWPELGAAGEVGALPPSAAQTPPGYLDQEERQARTAAILCGPGNNGGDGYVIARLLQQMGWQVRVFAFGAVVALPVDARRMHDQWCALGKVEPFAALFEGVQISVDLLVDAVFGIGQHRALPDGVRRALTGRLGRRQIAVDVPSGLSGESGRALSPGLEGACDLTVTFQRAKPGHYLGAGPLLCGRLVVTDIGLPDAGIIPEAAVTLVQPLPEVFAKGAGHKFSHGHALVLGGGAGQGGAARLAARAALRIGAGLVTLAVPPEAMAENAARLDAVMLRRLPQGWDLAVMLEDRRISALCLGPGLGLHRREEELVAVALAAGRPVVLDADALTLIARHDALRAALHGDCILTPHLGEFARLCPDLAEAAGQGDRVLAVRQAAARLGAVVLLKGPDTVIAAPAGAVLIHAAAYGREAPWLATAGAGDVLSGLITGLLARGMAPLQAAGHGAWLHVESAHAFGPGLIAEDLPDMVPHVLRTIGA